MFKLALQLGYRSVRELEAHMDSNELTEWIAYSQVEPFPDSWMQTGVVASTIANSNSSKKKFKPDDFMPQRTKPIKRSSALDIFNIMKQLPSN